jgi:hypothetical protein
MEGNALALAQLDCVIICIDKDLRCLQTQQLSLPTTQLKLHELDFVKDSWPFGACSVGGIVNVHFLLPALFPFFRTSLSPGRFLLIETVPGCGGNYLELPKAGELRSALEDAFDFVFYKERKVGPCGYDGVTVQLVARRKGADARARID